MTAAKGILQRLLFALCTSCLAYDLSRCPPSSKPSVSNFRPFRNRCYEFVVSKEVYWPDANKHCSAKKGQLVTINDLATQKFIAASAEGINHDSVNGFWIGLNDRKKEGTYQWITGAPVKFTYWDSGQPDILHSIEDCVITRPSKAYHWQDEPCSLWPKYFGFICEYDMCKQPRCPCRPTSHLANGCPICHCSSATTTAAATTTTTTTTTTPMTRATCGAFVCTLDCGLLGFQKDDKGCNTCLCNV